MTAERTAIPSAIVRFAGDSGDGMQLTGNQFAHEVAWAGNDLATLPNFPAEIRAPRGTTYGVSSYQIQFGSVQIYTSGDQPDVLIAMNPAALKVHLKDLKLGGVLIIDQDEFNPKNLKKAGYEDNPLDDSLLEEKYQFYPIQITKIIREALSELELTIKEVDRSRNFFCLGFISWLYNRSVAPTESWAKKKFAKLPIVLEANLKALNTGYNYGETIEALMPYDLDPAEYDPGTYRQISGNRALALGLIAAATKANRPLVYGAYPITPASDLLHSLVYHRNFRVRPIQMEDEMAAICSVIGAVFGGAIGVTGTSGPGLALKSEAFGLAIKTELPIVVVNVQRAGPSTGMPTKIEQSDLLQAMFGRNGESPAIVLAPNTPGDCFYMAFEAVRLAVKYMTPVVLLSDAILATGSEPWMIPDADKLPPIDIQFATRAKGFQPYSRDENTLARPWAIPGTPGLEHRIGGLEGEDGTGNVCYDPENHDYMTRIREEKVQRVTADIPPLEILGEPKGDLLVLGWGSTYGAIRATVEKCIDDGLSVSAVHLRHLNPLPADLEDILHSFKQILVPEVNRGQLRMMLRAKFLLDIRGFNKVRGTPIGKTELREAVDEILGGGNS